MNCYLPIICVMFSTFATIKAFATSLTAISIKQPMIGAQQHQIYPDVESSVGGSATLQCYISPASSPSDSITLILWYRGDDISGAPIYSVDSRNNQMLDRARHFVSDQFRGRVRFNLTAKPALLIVSPIIESDDGQYWCRVDFKWTRTTISVVTLNVNVPPKQIIMKLKSRGNSDKMLNNSVLLNEGSSATFVCESFGGKPLPIIRWYHNRQRINHDLTHSVVRNSLVHSELHLRELTPNDLNSVLTCQTSNDNQTFLNKSIVIDINLRPTSVAIISINNNRSLSSGVRATAICQSFGSKPLAIHLWFVSSKPITDVNETVISDAMVGEISESRASFMPTPEDNGSHLICRAENNLLLNSGIEDKKILNVRFAPKVTLVKVSTGERVSTSYIVRGDDLRLHCHTEANPQDIRLEWLHNSHKFNSNRLNGVTVVNATLIVTNASDQWIGLYQCIAHNSEGSGFSNLLDVQIFYPPKCLTANPDENRIRAAIGQSVSLYCEVDSNPANVTFFWYAKQLHKTKIKTVNSGLKSRLTVQIQSADDFGQYSCWARNVVGNQMDPCLYSVYQTEIKQLVCSANISLVSLIISCEQDINWEHNFERVRYYLAIYSRQALIANLSSPTPYFTLNGVQLFDGRADQINYDVIIQARINSKIIGETEFKIDSNSQVSDDSDRSAIVITSHYNSVANNGNNNSDSFGNSDRVRAQYFGPRVWYAVLIALSCSVLLVFSIVIVFKVCVIWQRIRRRKSINRLKAANKMRDTSAMSISTIENLVPNPDVIPIESSVGDSNDANDALSCRQFINHSMTYQDENGVDVFISKVVNPRSGDKCLRGGNRVTVLSDFHANVYDWETINVSDSVA